jgi:hypothetical protein
VVHAPKSNGGLGILDPSLSNLALGAKILWRLVTDNQEWWKRVILNKYLTGDRLRCLDSPPSRILGSPIWKLLRASLPLFQSKATWIPGNGKKICVWTDSIMGHPPLLQTNSLQPLYQWCTANHKLSLFDISQWHRSGIWAGWHIPDLPDQLTGAFQTLCSLLKGCAPSHLETRDTRGWGDGTYSVKVGYTTLLAQSTLPPRSSMWNKIWNNDNLPKINMFCWTLGHGKILTGDQLQKRGYRGPHWCIFCKQEAETSSHIFLDCPFARVVWSSVLGSLLPQTNLPVSITNLFSRWQSSYRGSLVLKQSFKVVFLALPKFTTWKIWLARNRAIFLDVFTPPEVVAAKCLGLLAEFITL